MLILDKTIRLNIHLYTNALSVSMGGFFFTLDTAVLWQDAIPVISVARLVNRTSAALGIYMVLGVFRLF